MSILIRVMAVALAALAVGCGAPGDDEPEQPQQPAESSKKIDVAKAGNVTLTVWDQEIRGGQKAQIERLNEQFQAKYPNVTIKRVAKSFEDLQATLKLAVSDNEAPDVVQANQGWGVMGALVGGGLLTPLDEYAKTYGWEDRYTKTLLDLNRFSEDGKQFGSGNLYGVSQMGEIVGVYYNKDKVPELPGTFAEFEQELAKAKSAGDIPIAFGNIDKWPGIHDFETVQGQFADKEAIRDFVFGREGATFATPENEAAAQKLQEWAEKGYFTPDFNGTVYEDAYGEFAKGGGPFLIAGTWVTADLLDVMGDKLGFGLMPPQDGKPLVSLGGESLPFAITAKSANKDVAAAYIDFLTTAEAGQVLVETNNLPAMKTDAAPPEGVNAEISTAWKTLNEQDGLIPYLDYVTPTAFDDVSGAIQKLLAGRSDPAEFTQEIQEGFAEFTEGR